MTHPVVELVPSRPACPAGAPTQLGLFVAGLRTGWITAPAAVQDAPGIHVPVLLIAGGRHHHPIRAVDRFAQAVAAPLTVRLRDVEHVEAWNHDPEAYASGCGAAAR